MFNIKKKFESAGEKVQSFAEKHAFGIVCGTIVTVGVVGYALGYKDGAYWFADRTARAIGQLGNKYCPEIHSEYWKILNDHAEEVKF